MTYKEQLDMNRIPQHIAIIMDGNGRWAKKRGLPRTAGHAAGSEVFRKIATYCRDIGIDYLAWKNGPGLDLFGAAYNALSVRAAEKLVELAGSGMTDADREVFYRCLEQITANLQTLSKEGLPQR